MNLSNEQIQSLDIFIGLLQEFQDDEITKSFPYRGRMILLHNANPAMFERTHGKSTHNKEYYGKLIRDIRTKIVEVLFNKDNELIRPASQYLAQKGLLVEHLYNPARPQVMLTLWNGFRVNLFFGDETAFGGCAMGSGSVTNSAYADVQMQAADSIYKDEQMRQAVLPAYIQSVQARLRRIHKVYMKKMQPRGLIYNTSSRISPGETFITDKMQLVEHYVQAPVIGEDRKQIIDLYLKEAEVFLNIDVDNIPLPSTDN